MPSVISVNVGRPRPVPYNGGLVETGVFKQAVAGRVMLRTTNLDGDGQADGVNHGGEYKAAYAYSHEMYDYWRRELGREDFTPGQFGENLTVAGMPDDEVSIGDVFRFGDAQVQVSQPRAPCFKLGIRMGDAMFVKRFLASCRVGFYLRVLDEGEIGAGDEIELLRRDPHAMTVMDVCRLMYFDKENLEGVRQVLKIEGLSPAWREPFEGRVSS